MSTAWAVSTTVRCAFCNGCVQLGTLQHNKRPSQDAWLCCLRLKLGEGGRGGGMRESEGGGGGGIRPSAAVTGHKATASAKVALPMHLLIIQPLMVDCEEAREAQPT